MGGLKHLIRGTELQRHSWVGVCPGEQWYMGTAAVDGLPWTVAGSVAQGLLCLCPP